MPIARANGAELHYEVQGSGPPLMLVIGFTEDHRAWVDVGSALAGEHTVVSFDNRCSGRSTYDVGFEMADLAADVVAVADAAGVDRFDLAGQSMGGGIAQLVALDHPERVDRLVLLNSFPRLDVATLAAFDSFQELMTLGVEPAVILRNIGPWMRTSRCLAEPGRLDALVEEALATSDPQTLDGYRNQLAALRTFDVRARLADLAAPTLVVAGDEDRVAPPRDSSELVARIPDARMVTLPTGHASHHEEPALVAAVIADHLRRSS